MFEIGKYYFFVVDDENCVYGVFEVKDIIWFICIVLY